MFLRRNHPEAIFHWHPPATEAADTCEDTLLGLYQKLDGALNRMEVKQRNLVLSCEGIMEAFSNVRDMSLFKQVLPEYTIKVILYIRRIDKMTNSAILEEVKVRQSISDHVIQRNIAFREKQQLDMLEKLRKWESIVGRENIIVRPFEKEQLKGGDAVADFVASIDPQYAITRATSEERNMAISVEGAYFMARTLSFPANTRNSIEGAIGQIIVSSQSLRTNSMYKYPLLSPGMRRSQIDKLEPIYQEIAKKYLNREDGRLFFEPVPEPDEKWEPFEGLTFENTKLIYDEIITTFYQRYKDHRRKVEYQAKLLLQKNDIIARQKAELETQGRMLAEVNESKN